jgi:hypothetical protein
MIIDSGEELEQDELHEGNACSNGAGLNCVYDQAIQNRLSGFETGFALGLCQLDVFSLGMVNTNCSHTMVTNAMAMTESQTKLPASQV